MFWLNLYVPYCKKIYQFEETLQGAASLTQFAQFPGPALLYSLRNTFGQGSAQQHSNLRVEIYG